MLKFQNPFGAESGEWLKGQELGFYRDISKKKKVKGEYGPAE